MRAITIALIVMASVGCTNSGSAPNFSKLPASAVNSPPTQTSQASPFTTASTTESTPTSAPATTARPVTPATAPAAGDICASPAARTSTSTTTRLARLSGQGEATAYVRYDAREHEIDIYLYGCHLAQGARYTGSVVGANCAPPTVVSVGELTLLSDNTTRYAHATQSNVRGLQRGWWIAVSAAKSGGKAQTQFCGKVT